MTGQSNRHGAAGLQGWREHFPGFIYFFASELFIKRRGGNDRTTESTAEGNVGYDMELSYDRDEVTTVC